MLLRQFTLYAPNSQSSYAILDDNFYNNSKSKAFHLAFYTRFALLDRQARDKERATYGESSPVEVVADTINQHRRQIQQSGR